MRAPIATLSATLEHLRDADTAVFLLVTEERTDRLPYGAIRTTRTVQPDVVRLAEVNAAELRTPEGDRLRDLAAEWYAEGAKHGPFRLMVYAWKERYGRVLAHVYRVDDDLSLSLRLVEWGAKPYALHHQLAL